MGRKEGAAVLLSRELGPRLVQCGLGRGLLPYQAASSSIQSFGHNRYGPKIGWAWVCPACQVSSWSVQPFGHSARTLAYRQTGQTDRKNGLIGWTVLQTIAQKCPIFPTPCVVGASIGVSLYKFEISTKPLVSKISLQSIKLLLVSLWYIQPFGRTAACGIQLDGHRHVEVEARRSRRSRPKPRSRPRPRPMLPGRDRGQKLWHQGQAMTKLWSRGYGPEANILAWKPRPEGRGRGLGQGPGNIKKPSLKFSEAKY